MRIVLDTQAMLAFYLGEEGAGSVAALLGQIVEGKTEGYMNVVNLAELYYILARKNIEVADKKEANLKSYGIRMVPVVLEEKKKGRLLWKEAALIKTKHNLSLADAFAAATAKMLKATLVTGQDPDFEGIEGVKVERVQS